jgi:energy-coupling factor transport system ATP-binding protein
LLEGPTGSGKTTLLMAIRGLLPPGHTAGEIRISSVDTAMHSGSSGLILQNPKVQLLSANLGADVAFGLENHGVDPAEMPERVEAALRLVGLNRPLDLPIDTLSMGQQYRACLAGQLVINPQLVMMDEPVAQLDARGREKVLAVIAELKSTGRAVLICEHRPDILHSVVDRTWRLDRQGRLVEVPGRYPSVVQSPGVPLQTTAEIPAVNNAKGQEAVIRCDAVRFVNTHGELDLSTLSFTLGKGSCTAICGPNGSGKTTLIRALAGLIPYQDGNIEIFGSRPRVTDLRGRLTLLFQDPHKQIFETTVFDEVAFSARRSTLPRADIHEHVNSLLDQFGLSALAEVSPHTLSYGQKHLVGLAAVLAGNPEVVLLDDPFAGLDNAKVKLVMEYLKYVAAEHGTTIVWTTHDSVAVYGWADRVIDLAAPGTCSKADRVHTSPSETDTSTRGPSGRFQFSTGLMLCICLMLSMFAFAARSPLLLISLSTINLGLLTLFCRKPFQLLRKSGLLFLWQALLIVVLYGFRFGFAEGALPGFCVAWQLFLAFWPGMIFMASSSQPRIVRALGRVLPQRTAFVAATCLRFMPMLVGEMRQIREVQILRGAGLLARDLKHPRLWPDWISCLLVPTLVKTLSLADDIATAATARDFGIHPKRTAWPGD